MLLPFKSVKIQGVLEGPVAALDIELTYVNPDPASPIECSYEFPLDKDTIFAKLVCQIGDRQVEAEVKPKEVARKEYDQALARGEAAVLAERDTEKNESMTIKLGNLRPRQEAKLSLQLISRLTIVFGQYKFFLPVDFYPDYRNLGAPTNLKYGFDFTLHVKSTHKIQQISIPPNSVIQKLARGT